ncbi:chord-domain-containing protein [Entophlyctis helioformis]|nr:chord-domain-containing protein [Entophlyctis helioformis]
MPSIACLNKGCGQTFDPDADAAAEACRFHPGGPIFHEGLKASHLPVAVPVAALVAALHQSGCCKPTALPSQNPQRSTAFCRVAGLAAAAYKPAGWSCCTKKVTDFDDFLKIPGCTAGKHSAVAPAPIPKPVAKPVDTPSAVASSVSSAGVETFTTAAPAPTPAPAPALAQPTPEKPAAPREQDLHDAPDAVIAPGTVCRRKGCNAAHVDAASRTQPCVHHPGAPIFHEGSKGWSCCARRVLEFDEFLKIPGCTTALHRFTDGVLAGAAGEGKGRVQVECRRDWYQTPGEVIVSVFAKKVDRASTTVVFGERRLEVNVAFMDGSVHTYHTPLFQPIDPAASRYEILSTKIEIVLKKANGLSWVAIEPTDNVTSWTSFGITGSVGTIGGKEAAIATDAPIHLLQK